MFGKNLRGHRMQNTPPHFEHSGYLSQWHNKVWNFVYLDGSSLKTMDFNSMEILVYLGIYIKCYFSNAKFCSKLQNKDQVSFIKLSSIFFETYLTLEFGKFKIKKGSKARKSL